MYTEQNITPHLPHLQSIPLSAGLHFAMFFASVEIAASGVVSVVGGQARLITVRRLTHKLTHSTIITMIETMKIATIMMGMITHCIGSRKGVGGLVATTGRCCCCWKTM